MAEVDKNSEKSIVVPISAKIATLHQIESVVGMIANANNKTVADIAKCHVNTVGPKLHGAHGQYKIINAIFTALNKLGSNSFRRREHVLIKKNNYDEFTEDPAFDECLVFFDAMMLARKHGLKAKQIGDNSNVRTIYVEQILAGRPVFAPLVERVFECIKEKSAERIHREDFLFN